MSIVTAALLAHSLPALAQGAPVELTLRLAQGDVVYHTYGSTSNIYISIGSAVNIPSREEGREVARVLEVAGDGTMLIETVTEDLRRTLEGRTTPVSTSPTMARVRPDGRVTETTWGTESEFYPLMLPGRPVAVGTTWSRQREYVEGTYKARGTDTYTLTAIEQTADGRVARIRVQGQGSVIDAQVPIRVPQNWRVTSRGTARLSGEYLWSVDRGRLVSSSLDLFFDVEIFINTPEGSGSGSITVRSADRFDPLAASAVPSRSVDAAKIIVPGKSIGSHAMDMTITALTAQLGAGAATLEDAGLRVLAMRWPSGLVGFYERENQDKLVGLQIADTTYRTEKGIGYQSTQGEVVLTYGKPPLELLLPIPRSAVRMLIYDQLGLAFAIVADKEHTGGGTSFHAPVGAVDWTDVFPPGTAAKIYPLP